MAKQPKYETPYRFISNFAPTTQHFHDRGIKIVHFYKLPRKKVQPKQQKVTLWKKNTQKKKTYTKQF